MFYAWTPGVYVRARLLENILKDVKRDLVRVIANSVDVLCIVTVCIIKPGYDRTGLGVLLEILPRKIPQLVCAMFWVGPEEIPACQACRYTGP